MCEFHEDIYNITDADATDMRDELQADREQRRRTCPVDPRHLVALLVAPSMWEVDGELDDDEGIVEIRDRVTGYWCAICERMLSISLNKPGLRGVG